MTSAEQIFHNNTLKNAPSTNTDASISLNSSSTRLNVADISAQFSLEFYNTMSRQPDHLYGFYGKQSQMVHSLEGDLEAPICTTLESIHSRILSMGYQGARIVVESIDAQASLNGGIFILTTGNMKLSGGTMKKFVQSFFLAEQPNGYYVLNDCFRFIENCHTQVAYAVRDVTSQLMPQVTEQKTKTEPIAEPVIPKAASPVKEKKPEPVKEAEKPKSQTPKKAAPASTEAAKPAAPSTPSSWASLAAGGSNLWQDGVVAASKGPVASETVKETAPRRTENSRSFTTKNFGERRDFNRRQDNNNNGQNREARGPRPEGGIKQDYSRSIFVRNLGNNPDSAELKKVLESAGVITSFDFNSLKGQAFVEFETSQMAVTAINGKYEFNGVSLSIDARRPAHQRPGYQARPRNTANVNAQ